MKAATQPLKEIILFIPFQVYDNYFLRLLVPLSSLRFRILLLVGRTPTPASPSVPSLKVEKVIRF